MCSGRALVCVIVLCVRGCDPASVWVDLRVRARACVCANSHLQTTVQGAWRAWTCAMQVHVGVACDCVWMRLGYATSEVQKGRSSRCGLTGSAMVP